MTLKSIRLANLTILNELPKTTKFVKPSCMNAQGCYGHIMREHIKVSVSVQYEYLQIILFLVRLSPVHGYLMVQTLGGHGET